MNLIILESPNKVKKVKEYAGNNFIVKASLGHFRDLPKHELGVNKITLEEEYIMSEEKAEVIQGIFDMIKKYNITMTYLASDDDREGEAIAWHLKEVISKEFQDMQYKRLRIREITQKGVQDALQRAGKMDMNMVEAQRTRRVIDRLTGYTISPLLWNKFKKKGLSAGRVQSAILSILSEREKEIQDFTPTDFFKVAIDVPAEPSFTAQLKYITKENIEGDESEREEVGQLSEAEAVVILNQLKTSQYLITNVEESESQRHPKAPFTTATLQQEASQHLLFNSTKTMKVAQSLFEKGYITYHRTDSTHLAEESIEMIRSHILDSYGDQYVPDKPNQYKSGDHAQEAHEAIRPTSFQIPSDINNDEKTLLDLITKRVVASQMVPAIYDNLIYEISAGPYIFSIKGSKLVSPGYLKVLNDVDEEEQKNEIQLPQLTMDQKLMGVTAKKTKHKTQAPKRYTEKSLLQTLDKLGVGRPSTWANMIASIQYRKYAQLDGNKFMVTDHGLFLNDNLQKFFQDFLNVQATSDMENQLDAIAEGKNERINTLQAFSSELSLALEKAEEKMKEMDLSEPGRTVACFSCGSQVPVGENITKCNCGLIVFRKLFQKELSDKQYMQLLEEGRTELIKGFKSKKGNAFDATLYIDKEEKKLKLDFPQPEEWECPYCKKKVIETKSNYRCTGCKFTIWKKVSNKKLPKNAIEKLLAGKETNVIKGFTSKSGTSFDAALSYDTEKGQVIFVFPQSKEGRI